MAKVASHRSHEDTNLATGRFGLCAALAALAFSIAYGIPQVMQVAGWLHDPWDRILIFTPSLLLAPAFVLTMAAVHVAAPSNKRAFTLSALGLAIMYAVCVSIVYITQLSVVIPNDLSGDHARIALLSCCGQGQVATGIDLLGYTFMSLSTLLVVPVFTERWLRNGLVANGLLAPALIGQLVWPNLIFVGAFWLITFPACMWGLTVMLWRLPQVPNAHS